jgi:ribosome biogenesis GTPase A
MAKTLRELKDSLKLVDLVFETCDARIPLCSRNGELDRLIGRKPLLLILNKADLADAAATVRWIAWFRQQGVIALACDSSHRAGLAAINKAAREIVRPKTESAMAKGRLLRPARILVAGIPNTGKSTLINALCGRKLARTSDRPGVTRQIGWVHSGGDLELMDTPGVLPPRLGNSQNQLLLAATGAIRDDILPLEDVAGRTMQLLGRLYPDLLRERYKLEDLGQNPESLLADAALRRGCLLPGGRPDTLRMASMFLDELRGGRVGRITLEQPDASKGSRP